MPHKTHLFSLTSFSLREGGKAFVYQITTVPEDSPRQAQGKVNVPREGERERDREILLYLEE